MYQGKVVLCGANSYKKKYYLNDDFEALPTQIKEELKAMCVLYTEEVRGVLTMYFNEDGELTFEVTHEEDDFLFDEIGSGLKIKEIQKNKRDLLESVQMFYQVFFLGQDLETV